MTTYPQNLQSSTALDFAPLAALTNVGELQYVGQPFGFIPDGELLATVNRDDTVKLWAIATGVKAAEHGFGEAIKAVAFSAEGIRVATHGTACDVSVWDGVSGAMLNRLQPERDVRLVVLGPRGKELALIDDSGELWLYRLDTSTAPLRIAPDDGADRDRLVFSPDGARLATASGLGSQTASVRVWSTGSGELQGSRDVSLGAGTLTLSLGSMVFSSGGNYLAVHSGYFTGSVRFCMAEAWDIARGRSFGLGNTTTSFSLPGRNRLLTIDYEYRGTTIDPGTSVRLWDLDAGKELLTRPCGDKPVWTAAISPDGRLLALTREEVVQIWDAETFEDIATLRHSSRVEAVNFSFDGRRLAVRCRDGIRVWQATAPATQTA